MEQVNWQEKEQRRASRGDRLADEVTLLLPRLIAAAAASTQSAFTPELKADQQRRHDAFVRLQERATHFRDVYNSWYGAGHSADARGDVDAAEVQMREAYLNAFDSELEASSSDDGVFRRTRVAIRVAPMGSKRRRKKRK